MSTAIDETLMMVADKKLNAKQLSGRDQFLQEVAKMNQTQSAFEFRLANLFNAQSEANQQVWLKAAGCPLLTNSLCVGGVRLTQWRQLKRAQRNRMMSAYRCMAEMVKRGDA